MKVLSILRKSLRLFPGIFQKILFKPSKLLEFVEKNNANMDILFVAVLWGGLLVGAVTAIPHYYIYHSLWGSIIFTVALALTLAGVGITPDSGVSVSAIFVIIIVTFPVTFIAIAAVAVGFAGAFLGVSTCSYKRADIFLFANVIVFFMILGSVLLSNPLLIIVLSVLAAVGWTIAPQLQSKKIEAASVITAHGVILFLSLLLLLFSSGGGGIRMLNKYETVLYPLGFMLSYYFMSQLSFSIKIVKLKRNFGDKKIQADDLTFKEFAVRQKAVLLWGPFLGLVAYSPILYDWVPQLHSKLMIIAVGFLVMPIFILHVPDYLGCLPFWLLQRRRLLKKYKNSGDMLEVFKNSLLFKHEMLYFPLPGLHRVMAAMAANPTVGTREAIKELNQVYWFTFQQRQVEKTILTLGEDRHTAHRYINFLLEDKNVLLLDTLSRNIPLAKLYHILLEKTGYQEEEQKDEQQTNVLHSIHKTPSSFLKNKNSRLFSPLMVGNFFKRAQEIEKEIIPDSLMDCLEMVCRKMEQEQGYHGNEKMIATLDAAHLFMAADSLQGLFEALENCQTFGDFPGDGIAYFDSLVRLSEPLQKINLDLRKIETIERFTTKREFMLEQQNALVQLAREDIDGFAFYEPFKTIWQQALENGARVIGEEIKRMQGSAVLAVSLKNPEIPVGADSYNLCFQVDNTGQEMASDVSLVLHVREPALTLNEAEQQEKQLLLVEAGTFKELYFRVRGEKSLKTRVWGKVVYSDRVRRDKETEFSFPVTLVERRGEFKEIPNPYSVGNPLKGDHPLFFGREDAVAFIDKNILVPGGHNTILCHGLRRTGKSSLLYRMEKQGFSDKRLSPVLLDMGGIQDEKHFYSSLAKGMREKLNLPAQDKVESFAQFKEFLEQVRPHQGDRVAVLMLDEFEEIQMRVKTGKCSPNIFSNIRHLMQHQEQVVFLFCGCHQLEEMSADYWSIFFNTALYYRLSYLDQKDALRLVREPVKGFLDYDELAIRQLMKVTHGQPYLVQLLCRTIIADLNEKSERNDVLIDDVDRAVDEIIDKDREFFSRHIYEDASEPERLLLRATAVEMTERLQDRVGLETIMERVPAAEPGYRRKDLTAGLEHLTTQDILRSKDHAYWFPVDLLRRWLVKKRPLRRG